MLTLPLNSGVTAAKGYLLSFSLQGGAGGRPMEVYLRQTASGNSDLTTRTKVPISTSRRDVQVGFTTNATAGAAVELDVLQPNGAVWVDNVMLQEADITATNPDNYIIFKYNPTANTKTFSVNSTYYDAKGVTYSGKITLQPYSSIVLFKQVSATSTFKTSTEAAQAINVQGTMVDASAASLTASSSTSLTWQVNNQSNAASYFNVERSTDAISFVTVGKTTAKSSDASVSYQYNDATPAAGKNYYRITQYDAKDVAALSKVVVVNNLSFKINPNPVQNTMHLFFNQIIKTDDHLGKDVTIRSTTGATIKTIQLPSTDGLNMANLDVSSLKPGMYVLSIMSEGKAISKTFLKQ